MRPLAAVERFFEQLFERPTARLFRPRLQPIQLQRRIERAMENERMSAADRILVPNRFRVQLHPEDLESFGELTATLATDLAEGALAFARRHRYAVIDRPRVDLVADPNVGRGEIRVDARFADKARTASAAPPVAPAAAVPGAPPPVAPNPADDAQVSASPATAEPPATDEPFDPSDPRFVSQTMVFKVPIVDAPVARLRELRPNGTEREVTVDGAPVSIGRATDNTLVIHDSQVSRHHARLQARGGTLVFTDLASTNGSRVNGSRVAEVVLGEGDRIEIGGTVLVVESVPGG
ncbi:MAG: FhaA domain-containing protein [Chloroflexota bacterium]